MTSINKTFDLPHTEVSYKDVLEFAPIGIIIFQRDWKIKFANNNFFLFSGVLGEDPADLIGKSIYENRLFKETDIREELNLIKSGETFEKEIIASRTLAGKKISLYLKGAPILFENEVTGGILILEDLKVKTSDDQLQLSQSQKFQGFLNSISDFYLIVDTDGIVEVSSTQGQDLFDFVFEKAPDSKSTRRKISPILFKKLLENVVGSNQSMSAHFPFQKNQREYEAKTTLIPLTRDGFSVDSVVVLIEEMNKGNSDLLAEEIDELSKYQQITATIIDGLIGLNKSGKIVFWNESAARLFGLTRSEVYGKLISKIFHEIDEEYLEKIRQKIREDKHWTAELKIGEDESIAEYFQVKGGIIGEEKDETLFLLCSNITGQYKKADELKKSEERFRNIVTNAHDFICTLDLNGRVTYANPKFLEIFQYNENEILKVNFADLIDTYYLMRRSFSLGDVANGKIQSVELPLLNRLGQKIHVLASFATVNDAAGFVQYYNAIFTDITLKKESEKDLLLIRSVFEASLDGIALISKNRIVLVNDSFVKMFGAGSASEILGENPLKFVAEKDKERLAQILTLAEEGSDLPARYFFTGKRKNSTTFEVDNSVSYYQIESEQFVVWVLRDVTEEKKIQGALKLSEERYRNISENIKECIWTAENHRGQLLAVFYTPAIKKITGYDAQAFIDDQELWGKIIHPDDADIISDKLDKLYGDVSREFASLEYRIIDSLGNSVWIENKISLVRDSRGVIQKVFGIISDISVAKHTEEELKKSAANLKNLVETKDRFISIVSHDLRTPFSSIIGFTDLLLNDKELDEEKRTQYIEFIQESSQSMLGLLNSLLDWTRLQTGRMKFEPDRINARDIIQKSIQILSGSAIQKGIHLISELNKDFFVHADEELLLQVFNNLISNAIKFTKTGGSIKISAVADIEKRNVRFSVQDEGVGILKENIDKLFKVDSKYTTPGTSGEKGSGLGLSLVYEIIKKHGGEIRVESEFGSGTKFIFTLPVSSNYILLVEDMQMDRLLYSKLIRSLVPSYNILTAENGQQALEVVKQFAPALIITDHQMPVMTGYDLAVQLNIMELKYRPPVIVLSSDVTKDIEAQYRGLGIEYIFQKPVNLSVFKISIEQALRKALSA